MPLLPKAVIDLREFAVSLLKVRPVREVLSAGLTQLMSPNQTAKHIPFQEICRNGHRPRKQGKRSVAQLSHSAATAEAKFDRHPG